MVIQVKMAINELSMPRLALLVLDLMLDFKMYLGVV
jgi:hypothetical protein